MGRAGQLPGDLSKKDHGDVLPPMGTDGLHPARAGPAPQHRIIAGIGILCPGLAPTCTQQPISEQHPAADQRKASMGINPEAARAQRWVREHV